MATRDTSPGAPSLDDHVLRLGDLSDGSVMDGALNVAALSDAGSMATMNFWSGTQAAYDLLTPDANTLYFIEA